jgi:hypothetical protein
VCRSLLVQLHLFVRKPGVASIRFTAFGKPRKIWDDIFENALV